MTALQPYVRYYLPSPGGLWKSSGAPDLPLAPVVQDTASVLSKVRLTSVFGGTPPPTPFEYEVTVPILVDPLNPTPTDNVGWTGDESGGTFTSLHNVPAGGYRKGCVFLHDVIAGLGARFEDCIFHGGPPITSRAGAVTAADQCQYVRCTWWGLATSVAYWRNAINFSGTNTFDRCAFFRFVDFMRTDTGTAIAKGCLGDQFAFFDNDGDHPTGTATSPPMWTHNDFVQATKVGGGTHQVQGCLIISRCDTTGLTWSGGTPRSGTAINGTVPTVHPTTRPTVATPIGMPATQLNPQTYTSGGVTFTTARYFTDWLIGVYSNALMLSGVTGHRLNATGNWIFGGNDPSSLIQATVGTGNWITALRNKFAPDGFRTNALRKFFAAWSNSTPAAQINTGAGADRNTFGDDADWDFGGRIDFQSCADEAVAGDLVTVTTGGMRYAA